jgi:hypothetical protein
VNIIIFFQTHEKFVLKHTKVWHLLMMLSAAFK